jgi:hypothetical protein
MRATKLIGRENLSSILGTLQFFETVRIRIRSKQPDLDLYQIEKQDSDPDRYQSEKQDPDPCQKGLDPQQY